MEHERATKLLIKNKTSFHSKWLLGDLDSNVLPYMEEEEISFMLTRSYSGSMTMWIILLYFWITPRREVAVRDNIYNERKINYLLVASIMEEAKMKRPQYNTWKACLKKVNIG